MVRNDFLLSRNQRLYFIEEQGRIHCKIYEDSSKNGNKNGGMQNYWGKRGKIELRNKKMARTVAECVLLSATPLFFYVFQRQLI